MSVLDCVRNLIESLIKGDMISIIVLSAGFPVQNLSSAFSLRFTSQARNEESGCGDPREEKVRDVSLRSDL